MELLNALLELEGDRLLKEIVFLPPGQTVQLPEMKLSIVDVKCRDQRDTEYVVEMQLFNVKGFEERVVYNASKTFVMQLRTAEDYPNLNDVVGVTICDFSLWPDPPPPGHPAVPMLSRWRMQEEHSGAKGLGQVQYVFLELDKYAGGPQPVGILNKWAFFFREAENLEVIPPELDEEPFREALEVARMAGFSEAELELYDRSKMAEQDARGALELAASQGRSEGLAEGRSEGLAEGRSEGLAEGLRHNVEDVCELLAIELTRERRDFLANATVPEPEALRARIKRDRRWDHPGGPTGSP